MKTDTGRANSKKWAGYAVGLALLVVATAMGGGIATPAGGTQTTTYPSGMVAYWKFDGTLRDELGTYNGRMGSYGSYAEGLIDQGLHGAGGCSNPYAAQVDNFPNLTSFSIEAWIKPPCATWQGSLTISKLVDYGNGFILYTVPIPYGSQNHGFYMGLADPSAGWIVTPILRTYPCDHWYHVVAIRDHGVALRVYVNGEESGSVADDGRLIANGEPLSFHGWSSGGCGWGMNSITIDEVAMYDRVLTQAEIQQHYEEGLDGLGHEITLAITCPPDVSDLECGASTDPDDTGWATATPEDPAPDITYEDVAEEGDCPGERVISRTWTATDPDDSSHHVSCVQTITIVDTTPPVIIRNGSATVTLECGDSPYVDPSATATDGCDGDIGPVVGGDVVDVSTCGTYLVTYDATDGCGNEADTVTRTVHVVDTTAPVVTSLTASPTSLWPPNNQMKTVNVSVSTTDAVGVTSKKIVSATSDEAEGNDVDIQITGDLTLDLRAQRDGSGGGRHYTIVVRCTDAAGNFKEASVVVTVPHDQR